MHDPVIDNARIVDGSGAPARPGSVAVSGGRITAVGIGSGEAAREWLNARGLVLAPGFIDPHTHYDVHDLPGGGKRLVAQARGIHATLVSGQVLYRDGAHTGAWPGAVLRHRP